MADATVAARGSIVAVARLVQSRGRRRSAKAHEGRLGIRHGRSSSPRETRRSTGTRRVTGLHLHTSRWELSPSAGWFGSKSLRSNPGSGNRYTLLYPPPARSLLPGLQFHGGRSTR